MPDPTLAPEVMLWTDARRAGVVERIVGLMGDAIRPIAVGGSRSAEVGDMARRLNCPAEDDFRKLLVERPAGFVLLATMEGVGRDDIAAAIAQGSVLMTLEPAAAELDDAPTRPAAGPGRLVFVPAFRRSPGWLSAALPAPETLGTPRLVSFASSGNPDECSLFARLYDAWQVVLSLVQVPESIDASLAGPLAEAPDELRAATGHLAAHARLPEGGAVILEVSDRAGRAARCLRVVGDQGSLRVWDSGYQLCDAAGNVLDEKPTHAHPDPFPGLVAAQWMRLLDRPDAPADETPGQDDSHPRACCLASLLSARTAQPESPGKLLSIQRR